MKKLIVLFLIIFWSQIVDAAVIHNITYRGSNPDAIRLIGGVSFFALIYICFIMVNFLLEESDKPKDEQDKLKQNGVRSSKKNKPVNEKFKKYEIYTSKNFKKKK
jgi:hypothetical protein